MTYRNGDILTGWRVDNCGSTRGYLVNEAGEIIRLDMPGFQPSGQWKVRNVFRAAPFGHLSPFGAAWQTAFDTIAKEDRATFKNGKPKFYLGDFDHGSARTQMCGIYNIAKGKWRYVERNGVPAYWEFV